MGCSLNGFWSNIIGYADDLVLLAPQSEALQVIMNKLHQLPNERGLKINVGNCAVIVYGILKSERKISNITLARQDIKRVQNWKYFTLLITENMTIALDVDGAQGAFLRQFNAVYSKFNYTSTEVLCFLFRFCAASFHGAETWYSVLRQNDLYKIRVVHLCAAINTDGLKNWDSNHIGFQVVGEPIFSYLLANRYLGFMFSLMESSSLC